MLTRWKIAIAAGAALIGWRLMCHTPAKTVGPVLSLSIKVEPATVIIGDRAKLVAVVGETTGTPAYQWIALGGAVDEATSATAEWTAPTRPGTYEIKLGVTDGERSASASASIQVRLPKPDSEAFRRARIVAARDKMEARYRMLADRAAEHRAIARQPKVTMRDHFVARMALEELGALLIQMGEFEEALEVYEELATGEMAGQRRQQYDERLGYVKYMLGDSEGALRDFKDGGPFTTGMSAHYMGTVQEQKGDLEGALASYRKAQRSARTDQDPLFREALLASKLGAPDAEIVALLVEASPRVGGEEMTARMTSDPELAAIWKMVEASGRRNELSPRMPLAGIPDEPYTQPVRTREPPSSGDPGVAP